ncbi:respiratory chain complex I subunit 1 family protein [Vibrio variabilis]|uniref:respiratory chain complex I subunit 1 family protein n=1 Tax=Vibrio variabilis TaxID=990271 RepID=UPI000DDA39EB|nr:respiratory chain complex I subunit 1 family protein [Vibrio variabilis]
MPELTTLSTQWVVLGALQAALVLTLVPLATGFSRLIRARMHSRRGAGILQEYRDLNKLLRRQAVGPANSGLSFKIMPWILVVTMLLIVIALPVLTYRSPVPMSGDLITVIYLFAIYRFFFSLSGIDSNSMFAGIGSSRELTIGVLVEPVLMLATIVVALVAGSTDLSVMGQAVATEASEYPIVLMLACVACAFSVFIEMGKMPFDVAEAEQEIQEGPLTEYSGLELALIKLGLGLKQVVIAMFFIAMFIPWGKANDLTVIGLIGAFALLVIKVGVLMLFVCIFENSVARVRFVDSGHITWSAFAFAVLATAFYILSV